MTPALLVGIDVGTTSVKAAVVGVDGRELAHGRAVMPWRHVPTGAEIEPAALIDAAFAAAREALSRSPDGQVLGVGVTSMAETGVLADAAGDPVAPAIAWHDARGGDEMRCLASALGPAEFTRRTGLELRPLCTAAKYAWLRANVPGTVHARRWFSVAEWIVSGLGGDPGAELSLASRTGWLDLAGRRWWPEALDACGVPNGLLAELRPAAAPAGRVGRGPQRLHGATLAVCGHDHLCGAVGVGATGDDDVFDSCGTAEAFVASVPPPLDPAAVERSVASGVTVGWHVVPERQALLGAQRAGLALQRVLDLLGVDSAGRETLDAAALDADPGRLRWEGLEDEHATLTGIGRDPSPGALWRAALDRSAEGAADLLGAVEAVAGPTRRLVVGGGWARSRALRAAKAARLGPFVHPRVDEPGVRGAALLAAVAAGEYGDVKELPRPPGRAEQEGP